MKRILVAAAMLWPLVPLPAQASPAFGFPPPSLTGRFANVLRDQVEFSAADGVLHGDGHLGRHAVRITARRDGAGLAGSARLDADGEAKCTATLDGATMVLRIGDVEWRIEPEVTLDPALAELGDPVVDAGRQWTVALYLGGDNSLEDAAVADLLEMQRGM
ncbi:MAG: hypothetical protein KDC98_21500, partial [Planctomycetes bacterium]|nr:hypothetical protein [Planctomycetota bacterium]